MSKRKKKSYYREENTFLKKVLYVIGIFLLIAGLGFIYKENQKRDFQNAEKLQMLVEEEKSEMETETETETITETETEKITEIETETETETETEPIVDVRKLEILILNSTGRAGVAGNWRDYLTSQRYENIYVGTLVGTASEDDTIIYTDDKRKAEQILPLFTKPQVKIGKVESGIEDVSPPDNVDLYIIIGKNDIR